MIKGMKLSVSPYWISLLSLIDLSHLLSCGSSPDFVVFMKSENGYVRNQFVQFISLVHLAR